VAVRGRTAENKTYPATDIDLPPGGVLALYTDGLFEQPGLDTGAAMSRLAAPCPPAPQIARPGVRRRARQPCPPRPGRLALLLVRTTAQTAR
jgi:hypothetical protein